MNTPNKLTVFRILLVPAMVIISLIQIPGTIANIPLSSIIIDIIFAIGAITDKLDGYLARKNHQVTTFGKFLDPIADKIIVISAMLILVEKGMLPAWIPIIIITREFAVSGLRTVAASEGTVIAASWWGKIKTVTQIIAILLLLLQVNIESIKALNSSFEASAFLNNFFAYAPKIALFIAIAMTIISGIDYFIKNKGAISSNK